MRRQNELAVIVAAVLIVALRGSPAQTASYVAYSLNVAKQALAGSEDTPAEVFRLGGISRPIAVVYDRARQDVVLVGEKSDANSINLEDFVIALRAVLKVGKTPLVSIEWTGQERKHQVVRFEGGIENTGFGMSLLEADGVLKRIALGKLSTEIWGVRSYFHMAADDWRTTGREKPVVSRFWFVPDKRRSFVDVNDGVGVVKALHLLVRTEVTAAGRCGRHPEEIGSFRDEIGERFASAMSANLAEIALYYPEVACLDPLFRLTGLAESVRRWKEKFHIDATGALSFWVEQFAIKKTQTPRSYPVIKSEAERDEEGHRRSMSIEGGVDLKPLILELQDGSSTALRDLVVKSRPEGDPLTWPVPLLDKILKRPSDAGSVRDLEKELRQVPAFRRLGVSLRRSYDSHGLTAETGGSPFRDASFQSFGLDRYSFTAGTGPAPPVYSHRIGGVMLSGAAEVPGNDAAKVHLASGHFSLVVDGKDARIAPEAYRKFVTALWCVYYTRQDPGISIDPIAPGVEEHLVRYIGNVINTDLGRVMREADYRMKKWAVGTERPDVEGLSSVDDLWARHGLRDVGASRRFWFVPEQMRFSRAGDLLLFESGRMRVRTEYAVQEMAGRRDPACEAFATAFTEKYQQIAEKHPEYKELFEYAKMVSLAKYLKHQGVALHWFLMANKDLVLTEDSPGTVAELAKESSNFRGLKISGGVDLKTQGTYVFDRAAVAAIQKAFAQQPGAARLDFSAGPETAAPRPDGQTVSFELDRQSYSIVPQHSLSCGRDARGVRYQTDLAVRHNGQPGLELVRYLDPRRREAGEFGQGWRLLIPYRVRPADEARQRFLNASIPQRMVVENLVTGRREVLVFSADRYAAAGYVPEDPKASPIIGLFLMSDASYRLADKLGSQFHFDPQGYLTDMFLSAEHHVHIEYAHGPIDVFDKPPYALQPEGAEVARVDQLAVPARLRLTNTADGTQTVWALRRQGGGAEYVPARPQPGNDGRLLLMPDGSFALRHANGTLVRFDPLGRFAGMSVPDDRRLVRSIRHGPHTVTFRYGLSPSGQMTIAQARLLGNTVEPLQIVQYEYDAAGWLCRAKPAEAPPSDPSRAVARN